MGVCSNCGEQNPERAKFCLNCGTSLLNLCASCGEENPQKAKFCLNCGSPLAAADTPAAAPPPPPPPPAIPDEERKLDTLVFVDLVGSTAMAEQLDPEDVLALLERYYGRLRAELEALGGTVEKYIGDAIVTHFGVPVAHEDDPERAVRAGLQILKTVEALNAEDSMREIQVRIGIATGEVIVTHGQKAEEGKGIAWGDVLNTAARIESEAPVNGVLVGEETYRATLHAIEYREREPIEAKGKTEPVRVWEALHVKEAPVRGRVRDAPLIGRDSELERLLALWDATRADERPALATITGEAGIGKSRLLTEVAHRAGETGDVLWGRCLSYGEGITYWPVVEILQEAAGILKSDDDATDRAKIDTLLTRLCTDPDERRTIDAAFGSLLGLDDGGASRDISQAELHWGVRRALELTAAARPLILVFEDLHWAEPTLFELLDAILADAGAPILVLGTGRPELRELRPDYCTDAGRRISISLSTLGEAASEALLAGLLGDRALPTGSRAELLIRNAGGNPLYLEETIRMLDDAGVLDGKGDIADVALPTSLQGLIGSRLDGLPPSDKRVAQHASVVGMVFWSGAVADLHEAGHEVDQSLEALEGRDFVRSSDETSIAEQEEWSFKHALIKDVAYARVPKGRRANLHVKFVDWVGKHPGAGDELVEICAYHLEQACKLSGVGRSDAPPPIERAVDLLMRAAEKSERREGIREADRYYERALELLGDERSEQSVEAKLGRAGTLNALGHLGEADDLLSVVAEDAQVLGRADLRGTALIGRARIANKQGRAADARAHADEAEAIAEAVGDPTLRTRALFQSASVRQRFEGHLDTAIEEIRRGLAIAEARANTGLQIEAHMRLQVMHYNLGNLVEAEQELIKCSELLADFNSLRYEAQMAFQLGLVKYHLGELDEAERLGVQAREWLERTGETFFQLQNLRALALGAIARSDFALAEQRIRDALPAALETGGWAAVEFHRCLVEVLIRQDRLGEAREVVGTTVLNVSDKDGYARAARLLMEAALATADGQRDAAIEAFEMALRLLDEQGAPLDVAEARIAYGRALRQLRDERAAQAELTDARESLVRIGAQGLVEEVDRELAAMTEGAGQADPLVSS
jgi:class 3 adenylate cyclase/tetratricopeptide (TPR) repeat protein